MLLAADVVARALFHHYSADNDVIQRVGGRDEMFNNRKPTSLVPNTVEVLTETFL